MWHYTLCGLLASETREQRGLRLAEDLTLIKVVDHENQPVPPGVYGDKLLRILLRGLRSDFADEPLASALREALATQGALASVRVERVAELPRGATGKVSLIQALPRATLKALRGQGVR